MGRGISRGSSPDASQSGAQPRMRHGPICNAWPSPPRGRKNERQLQRMGRNLGSGRLCGPIVVVCRNFYPRKFVQPESCLSLVLRLCIFFFPSPFISSFPFFSFHLARGERIFERYFGGRGFWNWSKSRDRGIGRKEGLSKWLEKIFLLFLISLLRDIYTFEEKGWKINVEKKVEQGRMEHWFIRKITMFVERDLEGIE